MTQTPHDKSAFTLQWIFLGLALALLAVGMMAYGYAEKERVRKSAEEHLLQQVKTIQKSMDIQLRSLDKQLLYLAEDIRTHAGLAHWPYQPKLLQALVQSQPGLRSIVVVDHKGTVIISSRQELIGRNVGFRDYFKLAVAHPDPGMLYSVAPFRSLLDGTPILSFSRVVLDQNGKVDAVISGHFGQEYFASLLNSALYSPDMTSRLVHASGVQFVRVPSIDGLAGIQLLDSERTSMFARHWLSQKEASVQIGKDQFTSVKHVIAQQNINPQSVHLSQPLVVGVSRTVTAIYAGWYQQMAWLGGLYSLIVIITSLGLYLVQRRQRLYAQLQQHYFRTLDSAGDGVVSLAPDGTITYLNPAAQKLTGWTLETLANRPLPVLARNLGINDLAETLEMALWEGQVTRLEDTRFPCQEGQTLPVSLSCSVNHQKGHIQSLVIVFHDISLLKRSATALRQSTARLNLATQSAGLGIWEFNFQTRQLIWDDSMFAIYGVMRTSSMIGYPNWLNLVVREEQEATQRVLTDAIKECRGFQCRFHIRRASDGNVRLIESQAEALLAPNGRIQSFVGSNQDITEREQAAAALLEAERRFRASFDYAATGMALVNHNGGFQEVNHALAHLLGYSREELEGKLFQTLTHPDDLHADRQQLEAIMSGERQEFHCEKRYFHADGHVIWGQQSVSAVRDTDGNVLYYIFQIQDITAAKLANQTLANERDLFAGGPVMVFVWQALPGWPIEWASANTTTILGYSPHFLKSGDFRFFELIHPDDQELVSRMLDEFVLSSRTGLEMSYRLRLSTGEYRWFYDFNVAERDARGHILRMRCYIVDQTDLKQAEQELNQQRQRLEAILNGTNAGTWEWNIQDETLQINYRFAEMLGYSIEQMQPFGTRQWIALMHPEDVARSQYLLVEHFRHQRFMYDCELRLRHREGHWIWVQVRGRVSGWTVDGKARLMSGTQMDIQVRKEAEARLIETTSLLQSILDSSTQVAIIAADLEGNITLFNSGAERLTGYRAEEIVGVEKLPCGLQLADEVEARRLELEHKYGRPMTAYDAITYVPLTEGEEQHDWSYRRKDGSLIQISRYVTTIRGNNQEILGFLGVSVDITQTRKYEASLQEAKKQAENANQAKSQFLANMSHEIRTPMNAILGMIQLLNMTPLSAGQRDYLGKVDSSARSLLSLLNDILDISKVEAGKMVIEAAPLSLACLLDDLGIILTGAQAEPGKMLLLELDPQLPDLVVGDMLRLRQILINLTGNALKFTHQGEVQVQLTQQARSETDVTLTCRVKDTGIGISADQLQHIFQSFTQAEASTTRRFGGTGLGLGISQQLVSLMGGELQVHSEPGIGSEFWFTLTLPIAPAPAPPIPLFQLVSVGIPEYVQRALASSAKRLRWPVQQVSTMTDALAVLKESQNVEPILVLLDESVIGEDAIARIQGQATAQTAAIHLLRLNHTPHALAQPSPDQPADNPSQSSTELTWLPRLDFPFTWLSLLQQLMASEILDWIPELNHYRQQYGCTVQAMKPPELPAIQEATPTKPEPDPMPLNHPQRLAGLHVLVVEDNLLNQQVAQELLRSEGAQVAIASSGRKAITRVLAADRPFDAVFMDIQMPDMDGYAVTKELRQMSLLTDLPIIAMTANVLPSDRAQCAAVGMNDFLSKPVDLEEMVAVLLKWCRPPSLRTSYTDHPAQSAEALTAPTFLAARDVTPASDPLIGMGAGVRPSKHSATHTTTISSRKSADTVPAEDPQSEPVTQDLSPVTLQVLAQEDQSIDTRSALLRLGQNRSLYSRMIKLFRHDYQDMDQQLEQLLREQRWDDAERLVHTVKGLASTLGASQLAEFLSLIQTHHVLSYDRVTDWLLTPLRELLRKSLFQLAEVMAQQDLTETEKPLQRDKSIDPVMLKEQLKQLDQLLASANMQALGVFQDIKTSVGHLLEGHLQLLEESVHRLDFSAARVEVSRLLSNLPVSTEAGFPSDASEKLPVKSSEAPSGDRSTEIGSEAHDPS